MIATIVLSVVLLCVMVFFVWAWNIGEDVVQKENICALEICPNAGAEVYSYDINTEVCECYQDGELIITKILNG